MTLREQTISASAGDTLNVPANAPHAFHNATEQTVRLLCMVSPSGLEEYFAEFGDPLASRTSPAPNLSDEEQNQRMRKAAELAPRYRIENL